MKRLLAVLLSVLLSSVSAQQEPASRDRGPLTIVVLDGQNATNSIRSEQAVQPVIEVRDELGRPRRGVSVSFELPETGAGGTFEAGQRKVDTRTNQRGQASPGRLKPNFITGKFAILVHASDGVHSAFSAIEQVNSAELGAALSSVPVRKSSKQVWIWVAIAGAAGAGIAAWALSGGGAPAPPPQPSLTITPGGISVGGPR